MVLLTEATAPSHQYISAPAFRKLLSGLVQKQASGSLVLGDPRVDGLYWRVCLGGGAIHYASSTIGWQDRLSALLPLWCPGVELPPFNSSSSDYEYVANLWQLGLLPLQNVREILLRLSQEALVQCLAAPQLTMRMDKELVIDPILIAVPLAKAIKGLGSPIQGWMQKQPRISSPFQRLVAHNLDQVHQYCQAQGLDPSLMQSLLSALKQEPCLYQVARLWGGDPLAVVEALDPLIEQGSLGVTGYFKTEEPRPVVACIDDSRAVQRKVRLTLEAAGYRVVGLMEPMRALTALVRDRPKLVLMDISMPEVDGYDLCKMIKQTSLKDVPVLMLTGRDGILDRMRARVVGASGYITKPFEADHLIAEVGKYVAVGNSQGV